MSRDIFDIMTNKWAWWTKNSNLGKMKSSLFILFPKVNEVCLWGYEVNINNPFLNTKLRKEPK